jgi:hypothetical protein
VQFRQVERWTDSGDFTQLAGAAMAEKQSVRTSKCLVTAAARRIAGLMAVVEDARRYWVRHQQSGYLMWYSYQFRWYEISVLRMFFIKAKIDFCPKRLFFFGKMNILPYQL